MAGELAPPQVGSLSPAGGPWAQAADGTLVATDTSGRAVSAAPAQSAQPQQSTGIGSSAFRAADAFTARAEGGRTSNDSTGHAAAFGVDQNAHPEVDVRTLTPEAAQRIRYRYWVAIGGDRLAAQNPALATAVYDTAIMAGPEHAVQLEQAAGGDPTKFIALRSQYLNALAAQNPQKYGPALQNWNQRTQLLAQTIGAPATNNASAAPTSQTSPPAASETSTAEPQSSPVESAVEGGLQSIAKPQAQPTQARALSPQSAPALAGKSRQDLYQELLARKNGLLGAA